TFISGAGSDGNSCSFVAPCRTVQRAHDVTNAGGEVSVLDAAGYGALNITKAISIQGHGLGELQGSSVATAANINVGLQDAVKLSGLVIEGFGTAQVGINFVSGKSLIVENCTVRNFAHTGLAVIPAFNTALTVSNSHFV